MRVHRCLAAALAVVALVSTTSAHAVVFGGSISANGFAGPDPSCAPLPFHGVATGSGSSGLGSFTYGHDICLSGANGPLQGTFTLDFGQSTIFGDLMGVATPDLTTPGTADLALTYTVTGGTGVFLGATGTFGGTAFSDPRNGPPSLFSLNFNGDIGAPALPEPGTWTMLLLGFAAMGIALRRRPRAAIGARQARA